MRPKCWRWRSACVWVQWRAVADYLLSRRRCHELFAEICGSYTVFALPSQVHGLEALASARNPHEVFALLNLLPLLATASFLQHVFVRCHEGSALIQMRNVCTAPTAMVGVMMTWVKLGEAGCWWVAGGGAWVVVDG